ncbi:MAG: sensor histidine kinase [Deferrisomatales bacterium]
MRRKVLVATVVFCAVFVLAGLYIARSIHRSTSELDELVRLHQIELMREELLVRVQTVKANVAARNTRFFQGVDSIVENVMAMGSSLEGCFGCHHARPTHAVLEDLLDRTRRFEGSISRVLTIRANTERLKAEEDAAFGEGAELADKIHEMIAATTAQLERKTSQVVTQILWTNRVLYALLALGPLLAVGLAVSFFRSFSRPIDALLHATRQIEGGNLDHGVEGLEHEFRELGESFNQMARSLKEQMVQLQRTEHMVACGEVAAGLVHEIKNPLAGIKVSLDVLNEEAELAPDVRDILAMSVGEIGRIDSLMRGMLEFAKPKPPHFARVDVHPLLDRALELSRNRARGRGHGDGRVQVACQWGENVPPVVADPEKLVQVFLNLAANAFEAMPDGGTLSVSTGRNGDRVVIRVCDTGHGIAPGLENRLFEPFYTQKASGTGLGLAISRGVVAQHGGSLTAANREEGGACFTIELPLDGAPGARDGLGEEGP